MSRKLVLALEDEGIVIKVTVDTDFGLVHISDTYQFVVLTFGALAEIADAVRRHLDPNASFFIEEDLEAGRKAIAEYTESLDKEE